MKKEWSESCGDSCLKYVFKKYKLKIDECHNNFWITDIGFNAIQKKFETLIITNSKKMFSGFKHNLKDFLREKIIFEPSKIKKKGYNSILRFIKSGGVLKIKRINEELLRTMIKEEFSVIASLSSKGINEKEGSGHFVVLKEISNRYYTIMNPKKYVIRKEKIKKESFFKALEEWGGWVLFLKPKVRD